MTNLLHSARIIYDRIQPEPYVKWIRQSFRTMFIVYLVYYLLRPHMIINCMNVVIILFCLGVKIIFTRFHFLTNVCLV